MASLLPAELSFSYDWWSSVFRLSILATHPGNWRSFRKHDSQHHFFLCLSMTLFPLASVVWYTIIQVRPDWCQTGNHSFPMVTESRPTSQYKPKKIIPEEQNSFEKKTSTKSIRWALIIFLFGELFVFYQLFVTRLGTYPRPTVQHR